MQIFKDNNLNMLPESRVSGRIDKYYDDRYCKGYMEQWPAEKKQRVLELIKSLNLPETGDALDFGCGNGVFTNVIKHSLPGWNVYGVDISSIAIDNAKKQYPSCSFFLPSDIRLMNKQFDFLFSHHVLEHVHNVSEAWFEINSYLKTKVSILHILPCGNEGSLEYKVCLLRKDGINKDMEAKYFFEDISHLRRLNTEQMNSIAATFGFHLDFDYYSNQFYGAIKWVTQESLSFILNITSTKKAVSLFSAFKLIYLRILLLFVKCLRYPANAIDHKRKSMKSYKYYFLFLMLLMFYPFSKLTNIYLQNKANSEWQNERSSKNRSEMYLYYTRLE